MPFELHLLRHGETPDNAAGRFNGLSNQGLTERQRAALAGINLAELGYQLVYCSPLRRCVETAELVSVPPWQLEPRIVERDFGDWQGLTAAQVESAAPGAFADFRRFDADFTIPGGESRNNHWTRIHAWLDDVRDAADALNIPEATAGRRRILAVTHGGTVDFLYRLATHTPLHGGNHIFASSNAAVTAFHCDGQSIRLVDYDIPVADAATMLN